MNDKTQWIFLNLTGGYTEDAEGNEVENSQLIYTSDAETELEAWTEYKASHEAKGWVQAEIVVARVYAG